MTCGRPAAGDAAGRRRTNPGRLPRRQPVLSAVSARSIPSSASAGTSRSMHLPSITTSSTRRALMSAATRTRSVLTHDSREYACSTVCHSPSNPSTSSCARTTGAAAEYSDSSAARCHGRSVNSAKSTTALCAASNSGPPGPTVRHLRRRSHSSVAGSRATALSHSPIRFFSCVVNTRFPVASS
ncbi:hypothetical protein GS506_07770 [Rhodococcus hoagii]|nr:hypothetical protein [Prescottella equi]